MHVERAGEVGPRLLLVHGSIVPGWQTWHEQRALADRYRLIVPHRTGYPPNPPLPAIDFAVQAGEIAELLEPGTHVVGHSYGGVVSLLAVAAVPERVASLTVIEPPAFGLARGRPHVEAMIDQLAPIVADRTQSARDYLLRFAPLVGATPRLPDPLPPEVEASIRASMAERPPWEAEIPLDRLRESGIPVLVVSGAHNAAFEAVCDVLTEALAAERAVIEGARHSVQRTGAPFNVRLSAFVVRIEASRATGR